ncbi:MAG TPA: BON domain-containing protein [Burkholderiales bacterium]|nr:BON domain-containing protein [Burkholderiales bacterium]
MNRSALTLTALLAISPVLHGCFAAAVAGAGGAVLVAEDRRSAGTIVDDQNIELKAYNELSKRYGRNDAGAARVLSFNRYVLLYGEVPSEEVKQGIAAAVMTVPNVRNVQNELVVSPPIGWSQTTQDKLITSKVKSRYVTQHKFLANRVNVTTRNGVVYLMGLVTPQEADDATEIARTTGGVQKVVRVFELMPQA